MLLHKQVYDLCLIGQFWGVTLPRVMLQARSSISDLGIDSTGIFIFILLLASHQRQRACLIY